MNEACTRATVRAEVKRARRDGRAIDRRFLFREIGTSLSRDGMERLISEVARQVSADGMPPGIRRERGGEGCLSASSRPSPPLVKRWRKRA